MGNPDGHPVTWPPVREPSTVVGLDRIDAGFDRINKGFAEMLGRLDELNASQQRIIEMITALMRQNGIDPEG